MWVFEDERGRGAEERWVRGKVVVEGKKSGGRWSRSKPAAVLGPLSPSLRRPSAIDLNDFVAFETLAESKRSQRATDPRAQTHTANGAIPKLDHGRTDRTRGEGGPRRGRQDLFALVVKFPSTTISRIGGNRAHPGAPLRISYGGRRRFPHWVDCLNGTNCHRNKATWKAGGTLDLRFQMQL